MSLYISLFLLAMAILCGLLAIREAIFAIRLLQRGKRALGVVARLEADYDNGTPIIEYQTETRERREFRLSTRYWTDSFDVGQQVPVLYDPESPKYVVIDWMMHRWANVIGWTIVGLLFLGSALYRFNFLQRLIGQ